MHKQLFDEVTAALEARHAAYDHDVYADHGLQAGWSLGIETELADLARFADKTIVLPLQE